MYTIARGHVSLPVLPPKRFTRLRMSHNPDRQQLGCLVRCRRSSLTHYLPDQSQLIGLLKKPETSSPLAQCKLSVRVEFLQGLSTVGKIQLPTRPPAQRSLGTVTLDKSTTHTGFPHLECQPSCQLRPHSKPLSIDSRVSCLPPHFGPSLVLASPG